MVEIVFQNKREDFEAFYDYMVNATEDGKRVSAQAYRQKQVWTIEYSAFWGALLWGATGSWGWGLGVFVFCLILFEALLLLWSGFKPRYYLGKQIYKSQEKYIKPKDLQLLQIPRTIKTENEWLEVCSSEAVHRWRWRQVDRIGLTPNFIFIHVGNCPVVYIPKRDFPSEQSFAEFGKELLDLQEKNRVNPSEQ